MKAYIRPTLTHRERQIAAAEMDKITRKGICRAQWLMLITFNERNGDMELYRSVTEAAKKSGLTRSSLERRLRQEVLDPRGYKWELLE